MAAVSLHRPEYQSPSPPKLESPSSSREASPVEWDQELLQEALFCPSYSKSLDAFEFRNDLVSAPLKLSDLIRTFHRLLETYAPQVRLNHFKLIGSAVRTIMQGQIPDKGDIDFLGSIEGVAARDTRLKRRIQDLFLEAIRQTLNYPQEAHMVNYIDPRKGGEFDLFRGQRFLSNLVPSGPFQESTHSFFATLPLFLGDELREVDIRFSFVETEDACLTSADCFQCDVLPRIMDPKALLRLEATGKYNLQEAWGRVQERKFYLEPEEVRKLKDGFKGYVRVQTKGFRPVTFAPEKILLESWARECRIGNEWRLELNNYFQRLETYIKKHYPNDLRSSVAYLHNLITIFSSHGVEGVPDFQEFMRAVEVRCRELLKSDFTLLRTLQFWSSLTPETKVCREDRFPCRYLSQLHRASNSHLLVSLPFKETLEILTKDDLELGRELSLQRGALETLWISDQPQAVKGMIRGSILLLTTQREPKVALLKALFPLKPDFLALLFDALPLLDRAERECIGRFLQSQGYEFPLDLLGADDARVPQLFCRMALKQGSEISTPLFRRIFATAQSAEAIQSLIPLAKHFTEPQFKAFEEKIFAHPDKALLLSRLAEEGFSLPDEILEQFPQGIDWMKQIEQGRPPGLLLKVLNQFGAPNSLLITPILQQLRERDLDAFYEGWKLAKKNQWLPTKRLQEIASSTASRLQEGRRLEEGTLEAILETGIKEPPRFWEEQCEHVRSLPFCLMLNRRLPMPKRKAVASQILNRFLKDRNVAGFLEFWEAASCPIPINSAQAASILSRDDPREIRFFWSLPREVQRECLQMEGIPARLWKEGAHLPPAVQKEIAEALFDVGSQAGFWDVCVKTEAQGFVLLPSLIRFREELEQKPLCKERPENLPACVAALVREDRRDKIQFIAAALLKNGTAPLMEALLPQMIDRLDNGLIQQLLDSKIEFSPELLHGLLISAFKRKLSLPALEQLIRRLPMDMRSELFYKSFFAWVDAHPNLQSIRFLWEEELPPERRYALLLIALQKQVPFLQEILPSQLRLLGSVDRAMQEACQRYLMKRKLPLPCLLALPLPASVVWPAVASLSDMTDQVELTRCLMEREEAPTGEIEKFWEKTITKAKKSSPLLRLSQIPALSADLRARVLESAVAFLENLDEISQILPSLREQALPPRICEKVILLAREASAMELLFFCRRAHPCIPFRTFWPLFQERRVFEQPAFVQALQDVREAAQNVKMIHHLPIEVREAIDRDNQLFIMNLRAADIEDPEIFSQLYEMVKECPQEGKAALIAALLEKLSAIRDPIKAFQGMEKICLRFKSSRQASQIVARVAALMEDREKGFPIWEKAIAKLDAWQRVLPKEQFISFLMTLHREWQRYAAEPALRTPYLPKHLVKIVHCLDIQEALAEKESTEETTRKLQIVSLYLQEPMQKLCAGRPKQAADFWLQVFDKKSDLECWQSHCLIPWIIMQETASRCMQKNEQRAVLIDKILLVAIRSLSDHFLSTPHLLHRTLTTLLDRIPEYVLFLAKNHRLDQAHITILGLIMIRVKLHMPQEMVPRVENLLLTIFEELYKLENGSMSLTAIHRFLSLCKDGCDPSVHEWIERAIPEFVTKLAKRASLDEKRKFIGLFVQAWPVKGESELTVESLQFAGDVDKIKYERAEDVVELVIRMVRQIGEEKEN